MAERDETEVDVVDFIKVLIKWRWLILGGTLLCFVGAFIYGRFFTSPAQSAFEAKASVLLIPPTIKSEFLPNFSVEVYQILAKSPDLVEALIVKTQLEDTNGERLTVATLTDLLTTNVSSPGSTPIVLDFVVTSSDLFRIDPVLVVNTWAELFAERYQGISSNEVTGSYIDIQNQYDIAYHNLTTLEDSLRVFERKNRTDALTIELNIKNEKHQEFQKNYLALQQRLRELEQKRRVLSQFIQIMENSEGKWVGDFTVTETKPDEGYANASRELVNIYSSVISLRNRLDDLKRDLQTFEMESGLELLGQELGLKQVLFVEYKKELSKTGIESGIIDQVLGKMQDRQRVFDASVPAVASELGMRELLSIHLGVNLFQPRQEQLLAEIEKLTQEIAQIKQTQAQKLKLANALETEMTPVSQAYQTHLEQYLAKKKELVAVGISIQELQPDLAFSTTEFNRLRQDIVHLNDQLTDIDVMHARMTRNLETYRETVAKFTRMLEEARIAKAGKPEDIRIVARAIIAQSLPVEGSSFNPNLIVVVGGVFTVLLSFFLEYWEKAKVRLKEEV